MEKSRMRSGRSPDTEGADEACPTKLLIARELKDLLAHRSLDDITVSELSAACSITRQTFYYHFDDMLDLVCWIYSSEADAALGSERTHDTWQQGLLAILEYLRRNRAFVQATFHAVDPAFTQRYLREQTNLLLAGVVREEAAGLPLSAADAAFIASFYSYGFIGCVVEWIEGGMREEPEHLVQRVAQVTQGTIDGAVRRLAAR
ncbi:MAG: TetR/AcrR family transcriptional regulator C-terminal domain-containing protein [Atopobiaceae bacterium]|jgi:probable dihydroxyacetone kinase regulator|nr:TetR/AcrR family transcriptional regulator [Atopobiaceae bacterium]MCH4180434.1 TetR/AcrR family transcriptional regulator [Atopobiaceae bacterium]MCH4214611.1 TetR/AcrR family transcriptional regulator [Atopobiaceae bacterium]MCH4275794.1 TetR/AcrR family transcriptional regulator [Atopobiaceae bacterium]MCI1225842.1 TetR/AcrR family transcriptional regulator [Atopobiaceae bacterium]